MASDHVARGSLLWVCSASVLVHRQDSDGNIVGVAVISTDEREDSRREFPFGGELGRASREREVRARVLSGDREDLCPTE